MVTTVVSAPVPFQLLGQAFQLPAGPQWIFERKYDGIRAQIIMRGDDVRILTRGGQDWTHRFPELIEAFGALCLAATLDGEICALLDGDRTELSCLYHRDTRAARLVFFAFDVLEVANKPTLDLPLMARKAILSDVLDVHSHGPVCVVPYVARCGQALLEHTKAAGHEGVVAKRIEAPYRAGRRTTEWLKIKNRCKGVFRVAGWQADSFGVLSSLVLASHQAPFAYHGRVGTGFTVRQRTTILERLAQHSSEACEVSSMPTGVKKAANRADMRILVEVEYLEMGENGVLREPSFLRFL